GQLQQVAPPLEVYRRPANAFVGGFIGLPAMNFFRCSLRDEGEGVWLECSAFAMKISEGRQLTAMSREVLLGVRPQDLQLVDAAGADAAGRVDIVEHRGGE